MHLLRLCAILFSLAPGAATAQEFAPAFGRYLPMYPGMYFNGGYGQDERDSSYDQNDVERDSAAPQAGGQTSFPQKSTLGSFTWHFPMFESYHLPFFSSRTHIARVTLRYENLDTEGALRDYVRANSFQRNDSDLKPSASGVGDTTLEFGSFLYGSSHWRTRKKTPFAALLLLGINVPTGVYEHETPNTPGSNHWAFQAKLGLHWQPWSGGFVDGGFGLREHLTNYEPQFGRLAPSEQGDETFWDLSLGQRVTRGFYATAFVTDRKGDPNEYDSPQFAPNAPPPPNTTPPSDNFPTPAVYRDGGTALRSYGLALQYFATQRWLAAVHYTAPQSGRSGQFLLPFTNRSPAGCNPSASTCQLSDGDTVLVDGMGSARSYSSDRLMFTLTYNFGLGDAFSCTGCER